MHDCIRVAQIISDQCILSLTLGTCVQIAGYVVKDVKAPALTCNTVHGVQVAETCFSVAQSAGLTQEQFLGFNPNINCEKVFVGQWVCLDATAA